MSDSHDQIRNENKRYNFDVQIVPNEILQTPSLSPAQKIVFIRLLSYCGRGKNFVFPGLKTLAFRAGMNLRTVQRALKDLEKKALIKIKQRGRKKTNVYIILQTPDWLKNEMSTF